MLLAQEFDAKMLLDGAEELKFYDVDTTGHWWAVTQPFSNTYKIYIDDYESESFADITYPVFSPDYLKWAHFAVAGNSVYLIENKADNNSNNISTEALDATDYGDIVYSMSGEFLAYSYFQAENEIIQLPFRKIEVTNRVGSFFIDNFGDRFALVGQRLDKFFMNINGVESTAYDSINPIGFWHTGDFVYAALNGVNWEIYCGKKQLGNAYMKIIDAKVNKNGTILAVLVQNFSGRTMSIVFNDEYYEPVYGKTYDNVWGLALHPTEMLIGYAAADQNNSYVVQNSTEYYAKGDLGTPFYTYNGDELVFVGQGDFEVYINVNGKKVDIQRAFSYEMAIAKKPKSPTFAYTTGATLLVLYYEKNEFYTGFMCDRMSEKAIFNPKTKQYESLGDINNRLYLISCEP
jgi:hypothetical protein